MEVRDRCHDLSDVEIDILSSCGELEHAEEEEDEEGVAIVQGTAAAIAIRYKELACQSHHRILSVHA